MLTARDTASLPKVVPAVGRAAAPDPARPPAVISHPPTVYASSPVRVPVPRPLLDSEEETGSLTGDMLAPGEAHGPRSGLRILVIVLVVLLIVIILAVFGLTVAAATSEAVRSFFDSIVGG